ncbi:MAG TPA: hypothetical protein VI386_29815 [Candidatus Sulfotelmatobacter sp.]
MDISLFRGAYDISITSLGNVPVENDKGLSPLIVQADGTVFLAGQQIEVTSPGPLPTFVFQPPFTASVENNPMSMTGAGTITFINTGQSVVQGTITFTGPTGPTPCVFAGTLIVAFPEPTLDNAIDVTPAFDSGDGLRLQTDGGWVGLSSGVVMANSSQKPSSWFRLSTVPEGVVIGSDDGQYWVSDTDAGRFTATGTSPSEGAVFRLLLTLDGSLVLKLAKFSQVYLFRLDDGRLTVSNTAMLAFVQQFSGEAEQVTPSALLKRANISPTSAALTPCEEDKASFCWQMTFGLFLSLGVGSALIAQDGQVRVGVMGLLRSSPAWEKIIAVWTAIKENPEISVIAASKLVLAVLTSAYEAGVLWTIVKFVLTQAGWAILFQVLSWLIGLFLIPEAEAAELIASGALWIAGVYTTVRAISNDCGGSFLPSSTTP